MVRNGSRRYKSISEIKEKFFPGSESEIPSDPISLGIFLAEKSLNRIREELNQ
ncbi:MAG: hypothetical protein KKD69_05275 [Euryarchaeota archaeon]|nr:hypothetical protein [Euryarchaeota archaeon]MBU4491857.1 hypothetical protein [Euryarchaeota archaeon]MCG2727904.1 hypothetical protein [Candidatus Methanoperedenaceae archaeon]